MENRIEQLARVMRTEFDNITKDKSIIELLALEEEVNTIIETLILNGAEDVAQDIKRDFELELKTK